MPDFKSIGESLPQKLPARDPARPYANPHLKIVQWDDEQSRLLKQASELVHAELNIEKHADFIFSPSHATDLDKPRSKSWVVLESDGSKAHHSLLVEPYRGKRPTVKTRKVYLALQRILDLYGWDAEEKSRFSDKQLANILHLQWSGSGKSKNNPRQRGLLHDLNEELHRIRFTPFIAKVTKFAADGKCISIEETFTLLDTLSTIERKDRSKDQLNKRINVFRHHEWIRNRIKANDTRPTNLEALLSIKDEIAACLYAHLDIVLANSTYYMRRSEGLFKKDLQLTSIRYDMRRIRKQVLKQKITKLQGKAISNGILDLSVELTSDGMDWNLVARKLPLPVPQHLVATLPMSRTPATPREDFSFCITEIETVLGSNPSKHPLFRKWLHHYSYLDIVQPALSEYKADTLFSPARTPLAVFQTILHRHAHRRGFDWIRPCSQTCKLRPLFLS